MCVCVLCVVADGLCAHASIVNIVDLICIQKLTTAILPCWGVGHRLQNKNKQLKEQLHEMGHNTVSTAR